MAFSNETLTQIYNIIDAGQEYNTKLVFLGLILVYSIMMFYLSYNLKPKRYWSLLTIMGMRVTGFVFLFLAPLFAIFMYRTVSLITLIGLFFASYTLIFSIMGIIATVWGYEWLVDLAGIGNTFGDKSKAWRNNNYKGGEVFK